MTLAELWFLLNAVLWTGDFLLEGFDFGVGILGRLSRRQSRRSSGFCRRGRTATSAGPRCCAHGSSRRTPRGASRSLPTAARCAR